MAGPRTNPLVEELRRKIEDRHHEALRALDLLETYLAECQVPSPPDAVPLGENGALLVGRGSYKDRVIAAIRHRFRTVDEISSVTGIERERVRGVVYAKDMRAKLASELHGERKAFKYIGDDRNALEE